MATIKEVAALSNTSVSTASIVLRGDGDERKISKTTQDHVLRAAKELGYQPNTSARKLREKKNSSISVAVFWADDFRLSMAVRFMRGLQNAIRSIDQQVEFSFFLYQNDELSFKFANGGDWWFHAKNMAGSHVIVRKEQAETLPDATFEEAGRLAAYYSKGRQAPKVEVDYVQRKELRKPPKAKPGFVIYHTNYSMMCIPNIDGIEVVE